MKSRDAARPHFLTIFLPSQALVQHHGLGIGTDCFKIGVGNRDTAAGRDALRAFFAVAYPLAYTIRASES
jgi:hypothetical protein